ncbi:MAG: ROK family protein [Methanomassiliicoccales archaeon]
MSCPVLAVDLGGTWMRSAIVENGRVTCPLKKGAPGFRLLGQQLTRLQRKFLDEMSALVDFYRAEGFNVSKFAIGFPGPIKDGYAYSAPTLWGNMRKPYPLLSELKKELGKKGIESIVIENDVTAIGYSYLTEDNRTFCIITVSSGIGNKIFYEGRVMRGDAAIGGEIGHWYCGDEYRDFICDCGQRGHLGAVSSGRGAEKIAERIKNNFKDISEIALLPEINTLHISTGLKKRDALALETLRIAVTPLAAAMNLINLATGVSKFVLVGGFALSCGEIYIESMKKTLDSLEFIGHFTDKKKRIDVSLGADNDNRALLGLGRIADESDVSDGAANINRAVSKRGVR